MRRCEGNLVAERRELSKDARLLRLLQRNQCAAMQGEWRTQPFPLRSQARRPQCPSLHLAASARRRAPARRAGARQALRGSRALGNPTV